MGQIVFSGETPKTNTQIHACLLAIFFQFSPIVDMDSIKCLANSIVVHMMDTGHWTVIDRLNFLVTAKPRNSDLRNVFVSTD